MVNNWNRSYQEKAMDLFERTAKRNSGSGISLRYFRTGSYMSGRVSGEQVVIVKFMKFVNTQEYVSMLRELTEQGREVNMLISGNSMSPF